MDSQNQGMNPKRKFILIDQSIKDFAGHHYEYAHRVLKSAEKAGFDPILITNRKFEDGFKIPFNTIAVYQYGLWLTFSKPGILIAFEKIQEALNRFWINLKAKLAFSTLGMIWLNRTDVIKILSILKNNPPGFLQVIGFILALPFAIIAFLLWLLYLLIPFKPFFGRILSSAARGIGKLFFPIKIFTQPNNFIQKSIGLRMKSRAFTRDTAKWMRKIQPVGDDIIFIPTLGTEEMVGLIPVLKKFGKDSPGWHLLFRRNVYIGRNPEYQSQEEDLRGFKNQFKRIYQELPDSKLFFYTDTEELTNQYNRFGTHKFKTLPIPAADFTLQPDLLKAPEYPLNIIYTGDSRTEKGYHYFPDLVRDLKEPYIKDEQVRFTLQSNFNIPGGEPRPRIAKSELVQLQNKSLKLIDKILSTSEYNELLHSGDIIPILYDADNYYARSSGIFVEALVLGKPVLVPAGTWMAKELTNAISEYHLSLFDKVPVLKTRSMKNTIWHVNSKPWSNANDENKLILVKKHVKYSYLAMPKGATHCLIRLNQRSNANGNFVKVFLQELINQKKPVRHSSKIIGGQDCTATQLFRLTPYTRRLWIGLTNAYSDFPLEVEDIEISFIAANEDLPTSAIGVIYSNKNQIAQGLKELVNHFTHYHNTAQSFGKTYSDFHQPGTLVQNLVDRNDHVEEENE